jgi:hypothetical protein
MTFGELEFFSGISDLISKTEADAINGENKKGS